jgi:hypothetical protein
VILMVILFHLELYQHSGLLVTKFVFDFSVVNFFDILLIFLNVPLVLVRNVLCFQ